MIVVIVIVLALILAVAAVAVVIVFSVVGFVALAAVAVVVVVGVLVKYELSNSSHRSSGCSNRNEEYCRFSVSSPSAVVGVAMVVVGIVFVAEAV